MIADSVNSIQSLQSAVSGAQKTEDRQVAVLKKAMDQQQANMSKLLANQFNGVGQMVNTTA